MTIPEALSTLDQNLGGITFLWGAIAAPTITWIGYFIHSWRARKRRTNRLISQLRGLPPESKAVLVYFYEKGTHTARYNPHDRGASVLICAGILTTGPSGGSYDAIDRYLTISPDLWEIMADWIMRDQAALDAFINILEEPPI